MVVRVVGHAVRLESNRGGQDSGIDPILASDSESIFIISQFLWRIET